MTTSKSANTGRKRSRRGKKPRPLAPPPVMKSRKKARIVTTQFHKLTRDRDMALKRGDFSAVKQCDVDIAASRLEYQRASQLSTAHHSTSKWVLGHLDRCGWLYGIVQDDNSIVRKRKRPRRFLRLLEVGAINTELLDAASRKKSITTSVTSPVNNKDTKSESKEALKYRLNVKSIDLHSSHEGIEEADFLQLPFLSKDSADRYDVVVCSMVINCVATSEDRGLMLARLFHHLRPGGLCFLTLPRLCLQQSPYMTTELFRSLLKDIGFELEETKESPKIAFFVLRRSKENKNSLDPKWTRLSKVRTGKKFRNDFSVTLNEKEVFGCHDL